MLPAHIDKEISLLEVLKSSPNAGQRDMAQAIGLSLGMTNLLLKELSSKGWMLMRRLSARKVQYVLTPAGLSELTSRSYRYLKKSIRQMADYREQLERLVTQVKAEGYQGCALLGKSELEFVLDYLCRKHGLEFHVGDPPSDRWFLISGEENTDVTPNILHYLGAGQSS